MKKILLAVTLAACACVTALQAGEDKKCDKPCDAAKAKGTTCADQAKGTTCADQAKSACAAAKATCCEKEAFAKKIVRSPKRTELALK